LHTTLDRGVDEGRLDRARRRIFRTGNQHVLQKRQLVAHRLHLATI
jgi:hypothetical protein